MQIITLQEAKEKELRHYFTGKHCKHGHISLRWTRTMICMECSRITDRTEQRRNRTKKWLQENPEWKLNNVRKWRKANPDKVKEQNRKARSDPEKRKKSYNLTREWKKLNKGRVNANVNLRNLLKQQAVPSWADLQKIKEFYINCPKGYHVDHIIPLKNELVCGLHVENNLQYLLAQDNLRKHNKFEVGNK